MFTSSTPSPARSWSASPSPDNEDRSGRSGGLWSALVVRRWRHRVQRVIRNLRASGSLLHKCGALLLALLLVTLKALLHSDEPAAAASAPQQSRASSDGQASSHPQRARSHTWTPPQAQAHSHSHSYTPSPSPPPLGVDALTYYDLLQLPVQATASEIKCSYRKLAIRFHPDKVRVSKLQVSSTGMPNSASSPSLNSLSSSPSHHPLLPLGRAITDDEAQSMFVSIQEAYETLRNPLERKRYDAALRRGIRYRKLPAVLVDDTAATQAEWDASSSTATTASSTTTDASTPNPHPFPFFATQPSSRRSSCGGPTAGVYATDAPRSTTPPAAPLRRRKSRACARLMLLPVAVFWVAMSVLFLEPFNFVADSVRAALPSSPFGLRKRRAQFVKAVIGVLLYAFFYGPVQVFLITRTMARLVASVPALLWPARTPVASAQRPHTAPTARRVSEATPVAPAPKHPPGGGVHVHSVDAPPSPTPIGSPAYHRTAPNSPALSDIDSSPLQLRRRIFMPVNSVASTSPSCSSSGSDTHNNTPTARSGQAYWPRSQPVGVVG